MNSRVDAIQESVCDKVQAVNGLVCRKIKGLEVNFNDFEV